MNLQIHGYISFVLPRSSFTRRNLWCLQKGTVSELRRVAGITQDVSGVICSMLFSRLDFDLTEDDKIISEVNLIESYMFPQRFNNVVNLHINVPSLKYTMVVEGKAVGIHLMVRIDTVSQIGRTLYTALWGKRRVKNSMGRTLEEDGKKFGFQYLFEMVYVPPPLN
uniref:U2 protein n=1 Tax=Hapavirus flanders TaxID=1972612 RepID=T2FG60_9RHAB|nr:U2 protein [Hapavirus flanders]